MDSRNLFETKMTYRLLRLEYFAGLLICLGLAVYNYEDIRWWVFIILFAYIDVIGYIPGAIAYRHAQGRPISKIYYVLYNSTHSMLSALLVAAIWAWLFQPEWTLLAIPIHLFGDRSIFGNFLKPFNVSFEPVTHPEFDRFFRAYSTTNHEDEGAK